MTNTDRARGAGAHSRQAEADTKAQTAAERLAKALAEAQASSPLSALSKAALLAAPMVGFVQTAEAACFLDFETVEPSKTLVQNVATSFEPYKQRFGFDGVALQNCESPSFRVTASPALPAGLTIDPATGQVSGTPTATPTGASAFSTHELVFVSQGIRPETVRRSLFLTIRRAVAATPNTQAAPGGRLTVRAGSPAQATPVTASFGGGTKSYSIAPALPAGLTLNAATGAITGTPTTANLTPTNYTVTVVDTGPSLFAGVPGPEYGRAQSTFALVIEPALETTLNVPTAPLITGRPITPFRPVIATGGVGTITYSLDGTLPAGVSFNTATGEISGTPTSILGDFTYRLTARDGGGYTSVKDFQLLYRGVSAFLSIPSRRIETGAPIIPFRPVSISGGTTPVTLSISPALPPGLTFNTTTGEISGQASARLPLTTFQVTAVDSNPEQSSASQSFQLAVDVVEPVIFSVSPPGGNSAGGTSVLVTGANFGPAYSEQTTVTVAGFPVQNLTIANDGRSLAFVTPPMPGRAGFQDLVITSQGAPAPATKLFRVSAALAAEVTNPTLLEPTGRAVRLRPVTVTGGSGTLTYALSGTLPPGLSFNTATGEITGTASAAQAATNYIITVTDEDEPARTVEGFFSLETFSGITATVAEPTVSAKMGQALTSVTPVTVTGGGSFGARFAISPNLPAGLSLNTATGAITGTPTEARANQTYRITAEANLQSGSTTNVAFGDFALAVDGFPVTQAFTALTYFSGQNHSSGAGVTPATAGPGGGPFTYAISPALPSGLTLNASTGEITGQPTVRAARTTHTISIANADTPPAQATRTVTLEVISSGATVSAISPNLVGTAGGETVTVTGTRFGPRFADASVVTIGGTPVTGVTFAPDGTSLSFTMPARAAGRVPVVVTNDGRPSSTAFLDIQAPAPLATTIATATYRFSVGVSGQSITPVRATGGVGPLTYAIAPALPTGLSLNTTTGAISGAPTSAMALTSYTITVTDSAQTPATSSQTVQIGAINEVPNTTPLSFTSITPNPSVDGWTRITVNGTGFRSDSTFQIGSAASVSGGTMQVAADGTSSTFLIGPQSSGGGFNARRVRISSPLQPQIDLLNGFTPAASLSTSNAASVPSLELNRPMTPITLMTASGGVGPIVFSIATADGRALPAGLTFDSATAQLSGTPTALIGSGSPSRENFVVTATDTGTFVSLGFTPDLTRNVSRSSTVSIETYLPVSAEVLVPVVTLAPHEPITPFVPVQGGNGLSFHNGAWGAIPHIYEASTSAPGGQLPAGVFLNPNTGEVSGTPTEAFDGDLTITVRDRNTSGAASKIVRLVVGATFAASKAGDLLVNAGDLVNFSPVIASGGNGPRRFSLSGALPAGLTFDPDTGAITGRVFDPFVRQTFQITARDASLTPQSSTFDFDLEVRVPTPAITSVTPSVGPFSGGNVIVIRGTGFREYASQPGPVRVGITAGNGDVQADSFTIDSDTQITMRAPTGVAGAGWSAFVEFPQGRSANTSADDLSFTDSSTISTTLTTPSTTVAGPFDVEVRFDEPVDGFNPLTNPQQAYIANGAISRVTGTGDRYYLRITPTAEGRVDISLLGNVRGRASNLAAATADASVTFRNTPASIAMTAMGGVTVTKDPVTVDVVFSEDVTGFALSDLVVGADVVVSNLQVLGPRNYSFTLDRTSDGVAEVTLPSGAVLDRFGLGLDVTARVAVRFDRTAPMIRPVGPSSTLVQGRPFQVRSLASEPVFGLPAAVSVFGSAQFGAPTVATRGTEEFTTTVTPQGEGIAQVSYNVWAITDEAGNQATLDFTPVTLTPPPGSGPPGPIQYINPAYLVDAEAPYVKVSRTSGSGPATGAFDVKVAFTTAEPILPFYPPARPDPVRGFGLGDLSLVNATASNFTCATPNASGLVDECTVTLTPTGGGDVSVSAPAGAAVDAGGNDTRASNVLTVQTAVDTTAPQLTISRASALTNAPQQVDFSFSRPVRGFEASDVGLNAGAEVLAFGAASASSYFAIVGRTGDGPVTVSVAANAAQDDSIGVASTAASAAFTIDATAPTIAFTGPSGAVSGASSFDLTITFSEPVTGVGLDDFEVTNGSASNLRGDGSVYVVAVTPAPGAARTALAVLSSAGVDAAGNASASKSTAFAIDSTAPTATIAMAAPASSVSGPFAVTVDFSEPVVGFTLASLSITNGVATGFNCPPADGMSPAAVRSCTLTISPVSDGQVGVSLGAGAVTDRVGNPVAAASFSVAAQGLSPSLAITGPSALQSGPFTVTFTFSEAVTGFDLADVAVTNGAASNLSGSGAVYTATITPTGDGPVNVSVAQGAASSATAQLSSAAAFAATADVTSPTLTLTGPSGPQAGAFTATFTFSESVTGFDLADIAVTNGAASNLQGSGAAYTATITPAADGPVTIAVAAGAAQDGVARTSLAPTSLVIDADLTAPTLAITAPAGIQGGAFAVTFTFSKPVTGFDLADIAVANGAASNLQGSGASYTATITPAADGPVTISVAAGAASSAGGNTSLAGSASATVDTSVPTLTITGPSAAQTTPFTVTFTFSQPVTGFDIGDVTVTNGVVSNLQGSGAVYTATITPGLAGPVTVAVAAGSAENGAGRASQAASFAAQSAVQDPTLTIAGPATVQTGPFTATFTFSEAVSGFDLSDVTVTNGAASALTGSGAVYTATITPAADGPVTVAVAQGAAASVSVLRPSLAATFAATADLTAPSLAIAAPSAAQTGPFTATFTFTEAVTGFDLADIAVTNGAASALQGSGAVYSATITPTADGPVTIAVAAGAGQDAAARASFAATSVTVEADLVAPSLVIAGPTAPLTGAFSVTFTFSKPVVGFDLTDVTIANGTASAFQGSGAVYTATITPTADGPLSIAVAQGAATSAALRPSLAASFAGNVDLTPPSLVIAGPSSVQTGAFVATFTFTEAVTGFDLADLAVTNGVASGLQGSGAAYTATITPAGDGVVSIAVAAGAAQDVAARASLAATTFAVEADIAAPTLTIAGPTGVQSGAFLVTFTFSKSVTGFTASDVRITNGALSNLSGSGAVYTATVTPAANGPVLVEVAAGAAASVGGNASLAATTLRVEALLTPPLRITTATPNPTLTLNLNASETDLTRVRGTLEIANTGLNRADFTASANVDWIDLTPLRGQIAPGQTASVTASPNARVNRLAPGVYQAVITITYTAAGAATAKSEAAEALSLTVPLSITVAQRRGGLTIVATTSPAAAAGDATFTFASPTAALNGLSLATVNGQARSSTFDLEVGRYDLTQNLPAGWVTASITCTGDADGGTTYRLSARAATIDLDGGENLVCTFVNTREEAYVAVQTRRAIMAYLGERARLMAANRPDLSGRLNQAGAGPGQRADFAIDAQGGRLDLNFRASLTALWASAQDQGQGPSANATGEAAAPPRFDVWVQGSFARAELEERRTNITRDTDFGVFYLGADYGVAEDMRLGVLAQFDKAEQSGDGGARTAASGEGWMVGPYAAARFDNGLAVDGRLGWGRGEGTVNPLGTYEDAFDTTRFVLEGNVANEVTLKERASSSLLLRPEFGVFYYRENQEAYVNPFGFAIPDTDVSYGEARFGPEIAYVRSYADRSRAEFRLKLSGAAVFAPIALMDESGTIVEPLADFNARLEAGVGYMPASGLNLRGEVTYDGLGSERTKIFGVAVRVQKTF